MHGVPIIGNCMIVTTKVQCSMIYTISTPHLSNISDWGNVPSCTYRAPHSLQSGERELFLAPLAFWLHNVLTKKLVRTLGSRLVRTLFT